MSTDNTQGIDLHSALEHWLSGEPSAADRITLGRELNAVGDGKTSLSADELWNQQQMHRWLSSELATSDPQQIAQSVMAQLREPLSNKPVPVVSRPNLPIMPSATVRRFSRRVALVAAIIMALVVLTVGLMGILHGPTPIIARIASADTESLIIRGGQSYTAEQQQYVLPGDRVVTGSLPVVLYDGSDHLYIFPDTEITLSHQEWFLHRGSVRVASRQRRLLRSEHGEVTVVGGASLIEHASFGTMVRADRGQVSVRDPVAHVQAANSLIPGQSMMVGSGLAADVGRYVDERH